MARRYRGDGIKTLALGHAVSGAFLKAIAQDARRMFMAVSGPIPADLSAEQAIEAGLDHFHSIADADLNADPQAIVAAALKRRAAFEPFAAWQELRQRPPTTPLASLDPAFARVPGALAQSLGAVSSASAASVAPLIAAAQKAGVPILVGTGSPLASFAVFRELELLVQAGLTPQQALQAATSAAAQSVRVDDSGTIEGGKRADLLFVTGNPLENISNVRNIKWVVANGKVYDPAKLRKAAGFSQ
jgi:imidazolonepropionase-like amidohydrolase